jgi:hypothetical protein
VLSKFNRRLAICDALDALACFTAIRASILLDAHDIFHGFMTHTDKATRILLPTQAYLSPKDFINLSEKGKASDCGEVTVAGKQCEDCASENLTPQ